MDTFTPALDPDLPVKIVKQKVPSRAQRRNNYRLLPSALREYPWRPITSGPRNSAKQSLQAYLTEIRFKTFRRRELALKGVPFVGHKIGPGKPSCIVLARTITKQRLADQDRKAHGRFFGVFPTGKINLKRLFWANEPDARFLPTSKVRHV